MKMIDPSFEILTPMDGGAVLRDLERIGRVCYKSEGRMGEGTAESFIAGIVSRGHESVIEHVSVSVRVVCDRGVSHELVRHRLASYSQESTRYCNYAGDRFGGELTVIRPYFWAESDGRFRVWEESMEAAERAYLRLLELGASPQEARSVLPNSLKTELVMTMNLRQWRHFFKMRTPPAAHPQMRQLAVPMLRRFQALLPVIFGDIDPEG